MFDVSPIYTNCKTHTYRDLFYFVEIKDRYILYYTRHSSLARLWRRRKKNNYEIVYLDASKPRRLQYTAVFMRHATTGRFYIQMFSIHTSLSVHPEENEKTQVIVLCWNSVTASQDFPHSDTHSVKRGEESYYIPHYKCTRRWRQITALYSADAVFPPPYLPLPQLTHLPHCSGEGTYRSVRRLSFLVSLPLSSLYIWEEED